MNGVINMNVGNGTSVQQMTVTGSQPGNVGGTIGGDADVDYDSSRGVRSYTRRCTGSGEEARWTREGEEREDVRSCFEGCHRHRVVIVFLLQVVLS
jgi:hypothetical protein